MYIPKVSIIIPVYNGTNYMREAIDSALAQTYPNIEVIVVNDGSTDNGKTEQIALTYGDKIRYFSKPNGGVATALNFGITKMTGEYFSWLSHDDMYSPLKIERQMQAIAEQKSDLVIVTCDITIINAGGQKIRSGKVSRFFSRSILFFLAMDTNTGLNGCSLLIPRRLFTMCGNFNPALKCTQDYDMWLRMAEYAQFIIVEEELVLSRLHGEQDTNTKQDIMRIEADEVHAKILSRISSAEFRNATQADFPYLIDTYHAFTGAYYYKTAAELFVHIFRLKMEAGEEKALGEMFRNEILGSDITLRDSIDTLKSIYGINYADNKPVILIHNDYWITGGIERVWSILFEELKDKYHFVLIHSRIEGYENRFLVAPWVLEIIIDYKLYRKTYFSLLVLGKLMGASLLIENSTDTHHMLGVYQYLRGTGIKTIAVCHTHYFFPLWAPDYYPLMETRTDAFSYASAVTCLTSFQLNVYAQHWPNGILIPNPNTFENCESELIVKTGKTVLCVGRFNVSIKRIDRILKTFKLVLEKCPDAHLVIVGKYDLNIFCHENSTQTVDELLRELDFPEHAVSFKGELLDVVPYFRDASVYLLTSEKEGFAMTLNEAGAHGVPCVINEIPGLDDIIIEGENGFIVPQNDFVAMADRVIQLLMDAQLLREMGEKSLVLSKRFDKKIISKRWISLIDAVLINNDQAALHQYLLTVNPPGNNSAFLKMLCHEYKEGMVLVINKYLASQHELQNLYQSHPHLQGQETTIYLQSREIALSNHVEMLLNSTSWKITKPLRLVMSTLRFLKHHGLLATLKKIYTKLRDI